MHRHFRGGQAKDQPASAHVDERKAQHIAKECSIQFRLVTVQENMRTHDHGINLLRDDVSCHKKRSGAPQRPLHAPETKLPSSPKTPAKSSAHLRTAHRRRAYRSRVHCRSRPRNRWCLVPRNITPVVVASPIEGSPVNPQRRVESPAERAVENSVARNERVGTKPRAPVPTRAIPPRTVPIAGEVNPRLVHVGFRQIRRAQAAEAVKVACLISLLVELLGLERSGGIQRNFASALQRDVAVAIAYHGLAVEYANLILRGVKDIQPRLLDSRGRAVLENLNVVLLVKFRYLEQRPALPHLNPRIGQAG